MTPRPFADIYADALLASCGWCWGGWGSECATAPQHGMHVSRLRRAERRGLITGAELAAVEAELDQPAHYTVFRVRDGRVEQGPVPMRTAEDPDADLRLIEWGAAR